MHSLVHNSYYLDHYLVEVVFHSVGVVPRLGLLVDIPDQSDSGSSPIQGYLPDKVILYKVYRIWNQSALVISFFLI